MTGFIFFLLNRSFSSVVRANPLITPNAFNKRLSVIHALSYCKSTMTFERSAPSSVFSKKFDWHPTASSFIGFHRKDTFARRPLLQIQLLFKKTKKSSLTMSRGPMANKKFSKIQFGFVRQRAVVVVTGQVNIPNTWLVPAGWSVVNKKVNFYIKCLVA